MAGTTTLLLVDDDPAVLAMLKQKLEATGRYTAATADGGEAALGLASALHPALIVSDIDMPGLDGGGLAARLREEPDTAAIPIVFLSSLVLPGERGSLGGWPMCSKLAPTEHLIATIDAMLMPGLRSGVPGAAT
jgi:CheY-like chemotaxis protein